MKKLLGMMGMAFAAGLLCASFAFAGTVKIGLMAPLTGSFASEGADMRNIVELLAEEVNKAGGINGDTVEIIVEDDGSDPRTAALAAQRLSNSGVTAVIGTYGSAVTEASQVIYDETGIVQVATGSTSVRLTAKGLPLFFRTCPRDDEQGRVLAAMVKKLGFKKIAILHDNSAYAKGLADETKESLAKEGITDIVFYDALKPNERDYNVILTKLRGTEPDVLLFTGYYPEAGMLLRQMKEMKWSVPMIGGDAANNVDLVKIAGTDAAEGYYFVSPPMPDDLDTPVAREFMAAFTKKFQTKPSSIWSVAAGDAFKVLVQAIGAVGNEPEAVAEYLHGRLKDFPALTGTISFDEKGDRVGDLYRLYRVDKSGAFILQK